MFGDLVKIDAWRERFVADEPARLFVELSFKRGEFGGESDDIPFTFSANLKRATLSVELEPPLKIDRKTVARNVPRKDIELNQYLSVRKDIASSADAELEINPRRFAAGLSGKLKSHFDVSKGEEMRVAETVPHILVLAQPGGSNKYSWDLEPSYHPFLENQPWDPNEEPRLSIVHADASDPDDRAIKVYLDCKRTDVEIYDLELKSPNLQAKFEGLMHKEKNKAAAIQYIKKCLERVELDPGVLDNRFSSIRLADILAGPE